ncbi:MAG: hypothetical protein CL920_35070 [Deltaproteobacteria bacterium]|nr:hypothetical protein [Deltaproteobacteria bacterium]
MTCKKLAKNGQFYGVDESPKFCWCFWKETTITSHPKTFTQHMRTKLVKSIVLVAIFLCNNADIWCASRESKNDIYPRKSPMDEPSDHQTTLGTAQQKGISENPRDQVFLPLTCRQTTCHSVA